MISLTLLLSFLCVFSSLVLLLWNWNILRTLKEPLKVNRSIRILLLSDTPEELLPRLIYLWSRSVEMREVDLRGRSLSLSEEQAVRGRLLSSQSASPLSDRFLTSQATVQRYTQKSGSEVPAPLDPVIQLYSLINLSPVESDHVNDTQLTFYLELTAPSPSVLMSPAEHEGCLYPLINQTDHLVISLKTDGATADELHITLCDMIDRFHTRRKQRPQYTLLKEHMTTTQPASELHVVEEYANALEPAPWMTLYMRELPSFKADLPRSFSDWFRSLVLFKEQSISPKTRRPWKRVGSLLLMPLWIGLLILGLLFGRGAVKVSELPRLKSQQKRTLASLNHQGNAHLALKYDRDRYSVLVLNGKMLDSQLSIISQEFQKLVYTEFTSYLQGIKLINDLRARRREAKWNDLQKAWRATQAFNQQLLLWPKLVTSTSQLQADLDGLIRLRQHTQRHALSLVSSQPDTFFSSEELKSWHTRCEKDQDLIPCQLRSLSCELLSQSMEVSLAHLKTRIDNSLKDQMSLPVDELRSMYPWKTTLQECDISLKNLEDLLKGYWKTRGSQLIADHDQLSARLNQFFQRRHLRLAVRAFSDEPSPFSPPQRFLDEIMDAQRRAGLTLLDRVSDRSPIELSEYLDELKELSLTSTQPWKNALKVLALRSLWRQSVLKALREEDLTQLKRLAQEEVESAYLPAEDPLHSDFQAQHFTIEWNQMKKELSSWLQPHMVIIHLSDLSCQTEAITRAEGLHAWYSPQRYFDLERLYLRVDSHPITALEAEHQARLLWRPGLKLKVSVLERDGEFDHLKPDQIQDDTQIGHGITLRWLWPPESHLTTAVNQERTCFATLRLFDQRTEWLSLSSEVGPPFVHSIDFSQILEWL